MNVQEFQGIPTGNICDSNGKLGAIDPAIQALDRNMTVVGRAYTVQCPPGDNLTVHKAMLEAQPGDVLVVSCGGYLHAGGFGELMATACQVKGIAGIVIDGACRDKNELIEMNFPTFVRATCPNGTVKERCGATGGTVVCGGSTVRTGDIIIGDCDGVVVIPADRAEAVLEKSLAKKASEDVIRKQLLAGISTAELFNLTPKFQ
jgi:4-hydroxy-4-methyl-2-oxoglutarate aldolase